LSKELILKHSLLNIIIMAHIRRRKSLRERVAARKAGRSEYEDEIPEQPWRIKLKWFAVFCQTLALGLLLFEIWRLFERDFRNVNYVLVTIYSGVFFLGRFIQIGLSVSRKFNK
jgi:hypothetical protein